MIINRHVITIYFKCTISYAWLTSVMSRYHPDHITQLFHCLQTKLSLQSTSVNYRIIYTVSVSLLSISLLCFLFLELLYRHTKCILIATRNFPNKRNFFCSGEKYILVFVTHKGETDWVRDNTLDLLFGRCSVRISSMTPAILTDDFRDFPQTLQENVGILPQLGQNRFLPNPLKFIIHLSSSH
jgi:hypothetical protein